VVQKRTQSERLARTQPLLRRTKISDAAFCSPPRQNAETIMLEIRSLTPPITSYRNCTAEAPKNINQVAQQLSLVFAAKQTQMAVLVTVFVSPLLARCGEEMDHPACSHSENIRPSHCGLNFSADLLHPAQLHADVSLSAINISMIFQGLGDFLQ
jgi:hypothetical protein